MRGGVRRRNEVELTLQVHLFCSYVLARPDREGDCALGLFWGSNRVYDPESQNFWKPGENKFLLTDWVNTVSAGDPDQRAVDCTSCAGALDIFNGAHGVNVQLLRLEASNGYDGHSFLTQYVCPIGSDASQYVPDFTYLEYGFRYHQVCIGGGHVADAAVAHHLSPAGNPHYNPAYSWGITSYWQTFPNGLVKEPNPATLNYTSLDVEEIE